MDHRKNFQLIAGPCAVESKSQIFRLAKLLRSSGITHMRAGAWKPRTFPDTFQGLGFEGLEMAREACDQNGLRLVSEIVDVRDVDRAASKIDWVQIGARNMQNFPLLREVGKHSKRVLLKRGFGNTFEEVAGAYEHIQTSAIGECEIVVCERGIQTFERSLRATLDFAGALYFRSQFGCPVFVDPSHATGKRELVAPLVAAAYVAGFDGAMIEVHDAPGEAECDGEQAISVEELGELITFLEIARRI